MSAKDVDSKSAGSAEEQANTAKPTHIEPWKILVIVGILLGLFVVGGFFMK